MMDTKMEISIPQSPNRAEEDLAEESKVPLSQFVARSLAEKVGNTRATDLFAERGKNGDPDKAIAPLEGRLQ